VSNKLSVNALRSAATQALDCQDKLLQVWRDLSPDEYVHLTEPNDVELLVQLIKQRIYPINAFGALVRIDKRAALDALLSRYVGDGVNPDGKFGGYYFELATMLDELCESWGETALLELINHPRFNQDRLKDQRVINALADALNIEDTQVAGWLRRKQLGD